MRNLSLTGLIIFLLLLQSSVSIGQSSKKLLILNNYNIREESIRKNKKAFFLELSDSLLSRLAAWGSNLEYETVVLPGYTSLDSSGISMLPNLLQRNNCSRAVVVKEFDVYFAIYDVEVTKDGGSKSKEAFYNIYSNAVYDLTDSSQKIKTDRVTVSASHSSRKVLSGLLSAGPNIMSNKRDAMSILEQNAREYMRAYFDKK